VFLVCANLQWFYRIYDLHGLVNNVGKSHSMPVYFAETPEDELTDIVAINVTATLRVTHVILPGMVQRSVGIHSVQFVGIDMIFF